MLYPELTEVCAALREVFGARTCLCDLVVGDSGELLVVAGDGEGTAELLGTRFRFGEGLAGYVAMTGHPVCVSDVPNDERFSARLADVAGYRPTSFLGAPLLGVDGAVHGVLTVSDPTAEVAGGPEIVASGWLGVLMVASTEVARIAAEVVAADPARRALRGVPQPPDST